MEADHLGGDTDMVSVVEALLNEQGRRRDAGHSGWRIPFRPDHGHELLDDAGKKTADAVFVKVVHNGTMIHENVAVKGPTTSSLGGGEKPTGPLLLQGDHGPVAFRNLRLKR